MMDDKSLVQDVDVRAIWGADLRALGCSQCGLVHLVPADWDAAGVARCPACLATALETQPARLRSEPPEMVVPFSPNLSPAALQASLNDWLRPVWLRPPDFRVDSLMSRLVRVYLPMWLVDGRVKGVWQARMGFDYQVESTQERFAENRGWTVRHLRETRVRWEPRAGRLQRIYHNLAVPALEEAEQARVMARLGHYQVDKAVAYAPATIAGAAVRIPSWLPEEAWPLAQSALDCSAADDCQRASSAQHIDEFSLVAAYEDLNWTQMLLPLYATFYQDERGRLVSVWINGQTGRIDGARRASTRRAWRLTTSGAAVAAAIFVLGAVLSLLKLAGLGAAVMTVGFLLALLATLPTIWAWQFNQANR